MKPLLPTFFLCGILAGCFPPPEHDMMIDAVIPVVEERLSLSPLISEATMNDLAYWPTAPEQQKILLENLNIIWQNVLAEFRRCEKLGLYTMVDDNDNPTYRISLTLTSLELKNNTLYMPVRMQAERLRDDKRFIYTLPAKASEKSTLNPQRAFHYYGLLLGEYRRRFPAHDIVSFFYPHIEQ